MTIPSGVPCRLRWLAPEQPVPFSFTYSLKRDGELVEWIHQYDYRLTRDRTFTQCLAPGRYGLEITADSGARTVTEFTVSEHDDPDRIIEIPLP